MRDSGLRLHLNRHGVGLVASVALLGITACSSIREIEADRHLRAGQAMLIRQDLEAALAEFQRAAQLAPHLAVVHSQLGSTYRQIGEYDLAIDSYSEAVRRAPNSFDYASALAQLYHLTERLHEAIRAYLHAVEIRPFDFASQLDLGVCYQQIGDTAQATERFRRAIAIDPERPQAYVNLGVALDAQGKYYEAIQAYKEALERDSRQPMVLVNLAQTYMKQDRHKLARHVLQEAIAIDSSLAAAHEALAYCLFCTRDLGASERSYLQALTCDDRLPRAHAGLGSIYMLRFLEDEARTDLRDRALEHWHRSLELDADQPRIRKLVEQYRPAHSEWPDELLSDRTRPDAGLTSFPDAKP